MKRFFDFAGRAGLAALLVAAVPAGVAAQGDTPSTGVFKTAQQIFDLCTSSDTADLEACDWFIMASHDMMKLYADTNMGGDSICVPDETTELDVRNAVIAYWRAGMDALKYSAVSTIYNALTAAYPC